MTGFTIVRIRRRLCYMEDRTAGRVKTLPYNSITISTRSVHEMSAGSAGDLRMVILLNRTAVIG